MYDDEGWRHSLNGGVVSWKGDEKWEMLKGFWSDGSVERTGRLCRSEFGVLEECEERVGGSPKVSINNDF